MRDLAAIAADYLEHVSVVFGDGIRRWPGGYGDQLVYEFMRALAERLNERNGADVAETIIVNGMEDD